MAIIFQHAYEKVPPLHEIAPHVPDELADIVMQLLQKDPQQRYQSAMELAEVLEAVDLPPETSENNVLEMKVSEISDEFDLGVTDVYSQQDAYVRPLASVNDDCLHVLGVCDSPRRARNLFCLATDIFVDSYNSRPDRSNVIDGRALDVAGLVLDRTRESGPNYQYFSAREFTVDQFRWLHAVVYVNAIWRIRGRRYLCFSTSHDRRCVGNATESWQGDQ